MSLGEDPNALNARKKPFSNPERPPEGESKQITAIILLSVHLMPCAIYVGFSLEKKQSKNKTKTNKQKDCLWHRTRLFSWNDTEPRHKLEQDFQKPHDYIITAALHMPVTCEFFM